MTTTQQLRAPLATSTLLALGLSLVALGQAAPAVATHGPTGVRLECSSTDRYPTQAVVVLNNEAASTPTTFTVTELHETSRTRVSSVTVAGGQVYDARYPVVPGVTSVEVTGPGGPVAAVATYSPSCSGAPAPSPGAVGPGGTSTIATAAPSASPPAGASTTGLSGPRGAGGAGGVASAVSTPSRPGASHHQPHVYVPTFVPPRVRSAALAPGELSVLSPYLAAARASSTPSPSTTTTARHGGALAALGSFVAVASLVAWPLLRRRRPAPGEQAPPRS